MNTSNNENASKNDTVACGIRTEYIGGALTLAVAGLLLYGRVVDISKSTDTLSTVFDRMTEADELNMLYLIESSESIKRGNAKLNAVVDSTPGETAAHTKAFNNVTVETSMALLAEFKGVKGMSEALNDITSQRNAKAESNFNNASIGIIVAKGFEGVEKAVAERRERTIKGALDSLFEKLGADLDPAGDGEPERKPTVN